MEIRIFFQIIEIDGWADNACGQDGWADNACGQDGWGQNDW